MNKKLIAIDIDDVVSPLADNVCEYVFRRSGKPVTQSELYETNLERLPASGLSNDEFIRLVHEYQLSDGSLVHEPVTGAVTALQKLVQGYDVVFVTSRDHSLEGITHKWFERHIFPYVPPTQIIFVGNHYLSSEPKTKSEVCEDLNAGWLIDDHVKYMDQVKHSRTQGLLFGDYAWNKEYDGGEIYRVPHWEAVLEYFEKA